MLALILIITGLIFRFIPHTANFSPVLAIALFGGVYLNKKYALLMPLILMIISDMLLGTHNTMFFTWISVLAISSLGIFIREKKNTSNIALSSFASAVLFYIITNLGVWLMGWYPMTLNGLTTCFTMAIPFFRTSLISTLVFSFVLFGIYEVIARKIKDTPLAKVLL